MRLYHYTCSHARLKILQDNVLRAQPSSYRGLIWLTDLEMPDVQGLGLTSFMLRCDRTAWKVTVSTDEAVPWTKWAHENKVDLPTRIGLDHSEGAMPLRWWVSEVPLQVTSIAGSGAAPMWT